MSAVSIEVQGHTELDLPSALVGATRLASGRLVLVCEGRAPESVMVAPFGHPGEGSGRAEALVQLAGGRRAAVIAGGVREEVLVLVRGGPEPALFAVDCVEMRPLWRLRFEGDVPGAPLWWRGKVLVADPPAALTAFDEAGHELWSAGLGAAPSTGPCLVGGSALAAVGTASGEVVLVDEEGAVLGRWSLSGAVVGLCSGPGRRLMACDAQRVWAMEVGREAPLWSLAVGGLGRSMACDGRGHLTVALEEGGVAQIDASGALSRRALSADAISGLSLTASGAVVGLRRHESGAGLVAWPLSSSAWPTGAWPHGLPSEPVGMVHEAHLTTVFCEGGEVVEVRFVA